MSRRRLPVDEISKAISWKIPVPPFIVLDPEVARWHMGHEYLKLQQQLIPSPFDGGGLGWG